MKEKKHSVPMPLVILCMGFGLILGRLHQLWIRKKRTEKAAQNCDQAVTDKTE